MAYLYVDLIVFYVRFDNFLDQAQESCGRWIIDDLMSKLPVSGTTLLESKQAARKKEEKSEEINSSQGKKEFQSAQQKEESFSAFLSSK